VTEIVLQTTNDHPCATVGGAPLHELPQDLYIPPHALEVFLETFSGPLDLLLYLIKKDNIDILDIPIAKITEQYVEYINLMQELQLELAAEYLVMAATLAEIKSRMLLPKPVATDGDDQDPRAELIQRLREYERFKKASTDIDDLPRLNRDIFITAPEIPEIKHERVLPKIQMEELLVALNEVLKRASMYTEHFVKREILSVRERMGQVLLKLQEKKFIPFADLFVVTEGRLGVVVTFMAILELLRQTSIDMVQNEPFAPIYLKIIE